jgi:hypothetical protein
MKKLKTIVMKLAKKELTFKEIAKIFEIKEKQLEELLSEIFHKINLKDKKVLFRPLCKKEFLSYRDKVLPIELNYFSYCHLFRKNFTFGEIYYGLKNLSSDIFIDIEEPHKTSFIFPYLLIINNDSYRYILKIMDYKGNIEMNFAKVIKENNEKNNSPVLPIENELNKDDLINIIGWFVGFIEGFNENIEFHNIDEFEKKVEIPNFIYGYKDANFYQILNTD